MQHDPTLTDLYAFCEHEFKAIKVQQNNDWKALDEWREQEARIRNRLGIGLLLVLLLLAAYGITVNSDYNRRLTALEAAVYHQSRREEVRNATAAGD